MSGNDMLAPRFLRSGGRAIVSGNAAAFPEVVSSLVDATAQGRDDEADHLMAQLESIVELGRSGAPDRLRELLTLRGIDVGRSRLKTFLPAEIPDAHAAMVRDLLEQLDD
jgi:dihydrodipicolinate synthase/N-acetylneuraminate lyase